MLQMCIRDRPLKEELNATRKDLQANKREMARLRKERRGGRSPVVTEHEDIVTRVGIVHLLVRVFRDSAGTRQRCNNQ